MKLYNRTTACMEKMQLQKPFLVNWLLPIVMKFEYITVLIIIYVKQFLDFDWPRRYYGHKIIMDVGI